MAHDFPKESLVCYTFASAAGGRDGRISFLFGKAGRRWNFLPAAGQEVFSRIVFWIPAENPNCPEKARAGDADDGSRS